MTLILAVAVRLKINSAKDNPAGLAMAKRMNAQLMGLSMANQNASDGVSIIETADGRAGIHISLQGKFPIQQPLPIELRAVRHPGDFRRQLLDLVLNAQGSQWF